jgi:hypothetical protein
VGASVGASVGFSVVTGAFCVAASTVPLSVSVCALPSMYALVQDGRSAMHNMHIAASIAMRDSTVFFIKDLSY